MYITQETITPEIAKEYLQANTNNRPCSPSRIAEIAGAMRRGEWMANGDSIRFSEEGVLLDGQGRLKACILSGTEFKTLVVRGIHAEAFKTMDLGKKRNIRDILSMKDEKSVSRLSSALRFLMMYESGAYTNASYSPIQLEGCLNRNPGLRQWMVASGQTFKVTADASTVLTVCYLGSLTRQEVAVEFARLFNEGVGLEKGSPVLALRERLQQDRASNSRLPKSYISQMIIHAYNSFANGDKRTIIKGNRNTSELPRIVK